MSCTLPPDRPWLPWLKAPTDDRLVGLSLTFKQALISIAIIGLPRAYSCLVYEDIISDLPHF